MRNYLRVLLAINSLIWFGVMLFLWIAGQGVAGFIAFAFLVLALHIWRCVEWAFDEFYDL